MKITMLENGLDSLEKGFEVLNESSKLQDEERQERAFFLKQAIMNIHHGLEILMKQILRKEHEILLFPDINEKVKKAFLAQKKNQKKSVFETNEVQDLITISYLEAFERLEKICGDSFEDNFKDFLVELNKLRNKVTHAEINEDYFSILRMFDGLLPAVDSYFINKLDERYKALTPYGKLKASYDVYLEGLSSEFLKKVIEGFQMSLDKSKIKIGLNDVVRVTDIIRV